MTAEEQWWTITAYHEAGHVVAALVCGFPFEYVTIEPYEKGITEDGQISKTTLRRKWAM
jgi:hypothetical protein